jgi:hypothetical protein
MCNFVSEDKANCPETKFHIQKYNGSENIENPSPPLEVTLGSSTDTNLGHNHTKKINFLRKKPMGEI